MRNNHPDLGPTIRYSSSAPAADVRGLASQIRRGQEVAVALRQLRDEGFYPDVIIGHCGWGETLFAKDVFAKAALIVYSEYYYNASGQDIGFDFGLPASDPAAAVIAKNAGILSALIQNARL